MKYMSWATTVVASSLLMVAGASANDGAAMILSDIHHTNQMEIHMGAMAKEKSQSSDVKAFGDQLVKDHQDADDQVLALAKKDGINLETPADEGMMAKHDAMKHQKMMAEISAKSGADFDKAFAKMMVDGHTKTIAKLQKADAASDTPADVKALIEKLMPTLQQHLATAQKLAGNA